LSSYSPAQSLRVPASASPAVPKLPASRSVPVSTHPDVELLALLTRQIASGRPLEALSLIDRLLAAGPARRDPSAAADLRVLRRVAELELARQLGSRQRAGSDPDAGAIATILDFADRILPTLQLMGNSSRYSILSESSCDEGGWREPVDWLPIPAPGRVLSDREFEVLELVAIGLSNQKIARTLSISEGTVKKHLSNVLAKLDAENRTEAVALARRRGMLE